MKMVTNPRRDCIVFQFVLARNIKLFFSLLILEMILVDNCREILQKKLNRRNEIFLWFFFLWTTDYFAF